MESELHAVYGFEARDVPSLLLLSGCFGIRLNLFETSLRRLYSDEARLKRVVITKL
jgi:hypothetical protein